MPASVNVPSYDRAHAQDAAQHSINKSVDALKVSHDDLYTLVPKRFAARKVAFADQVTCSAISLSTSYAALRCDVEGPEVQSTAAQTDENHTNLPSVPILSISQDNSHAQARTHIVQARDNISLTPKGDESKALTREQTVSSPAPVCETESANKLTCTPAAKDVCAMQAEAPPHTDPVRCPVRADPVHGHADLVRAQEQVAVETSTLSKSEKSKGQKRACTNSRPSKKRRRAEKRARTDSTIENAESTNTHTHTHAAATEPKSAQAKQGEAPPQSAEIPSVRAQVPPQDELVLSVRADPLQGHADMAHAHAQHVCNTASICKFVCVLHPISVNALRAVSIPQLRVRMGGKWILQARILALGCRAQMPNTWKNWKAKACQSRIAPQHAVCRAQMEILSHAKA